MRAPPSASLLVFLLFTAGAACGDKATEQPEDTSQGEGEEEGGGDEGGVGEDTSEELPVDLDADGYTDDVDCNDKDPDINPGAEEAWNTRDDDCDGRVDADGDYSGTLALKAVAVREGVQYSFDLSCPATLSRSTAEGLSFAITCSPDTSDPDAMELLGETLTFAPRTSTISGAVWDERVVLESSNGWDTFAEGVLSWPEWDRITGTLSLDTISLDMQGTITWTYDGA